MVAAEEVGKLRVNIVGKRIQGKPSDFINHVGLPDRDFIGINQDFEIKPDPMGWPAMMFPMHVPIAEEFKIQHLCAIFFFDFFTQCLLNRMAEFYPSRADVVSVVLVSGIGAPFCHKKFPLAIMAEKYHRYPGIIYAFGKPALHPAIIQRSSPGMQDLTSVPCIYYYGRKINELRESLLYE